MNVALFFVRRVRFRALSRIQIIEGGLTQMGAPNKDEIEGKFDQAKGSIKEGLGNLTGDDKLRSEGSADKLKGDVQEGFGGAKRKVGDMLEDAGDAIKR
jgi:uncharacterized protein YjbJ (UPF0337 family)